MAIFRAIVFSAVLAGLAVGAAVTVVQQFSTVPLILKAEVYERAAVAAGSGAAVSGRAEHEHGADAWEPGEGLERNLYTRRRTS